MKPGNVALILSVLLLSFSGNDHNFSKWIPGTSPTAALAMKTLTTRSQRRHTTARGLCKAGGISSSGFSGVDLSDKKPKTAVIVGSGPGGLASAMVLANARAPGNNNNNNNNFFDKVIVLDDAPKESYDPARAYFFNVNKRGQGFTDAFGIDLSERGVGVNQFQRQEVPGDPSEVFDGKNPFSREMTDEEKKNTGTMYWIPRHEIVELITDEIAARNNECGTTTAIEFRRGVRCHHIEPTKDGLVRIVCAGDDDATRNIVADLCVGADGVSSRVRQSLEDGRFDDEVQINDKNWSNNNPKKFRLKQYTSPSTGLRIKGLRIRSDFAIPKGGGATTAATDEMIPIEDCYNYKLASVTRTATDALSLLVLPQKDPEATGGRSLSICTMANHDLWKKVKTDDGGRSARDYFGRAFPRFDWDTIVEEDEWELFASTKGSRFPPCQYSPSMHVANTSSGAGVVLVGDALHAFPPDLGQGVNAAFCDAMVLGRSLEEALQIKPTSENRVDHKNETKASGVLPRALKSYEAKNGPETRALVALARCGAPFQYNQPMRVRKALWTANIALRLLLNKLTRGISPKPAVLLMMDPGLSFREIMQKANTLTAVLWSSLVLVLLPLIRKRFLLV